MKISIPIVLPLVLLLVSVMFLLKGSVELQRFSAELKGVQDSFASNFHAPIPSPSYEYYFLTAAFIGGIAIGIFIAWALSHISISIKPEVKAG